MTAPAKPPYRVPLMTEIAAMPLSGLTAVSTFSGAGGGCLGLRIAGFRVAWASEFVPAAAATYRANFPGTPLDTRDIRAVDPAAILEECGLGVGELDLLEGSPPCASFSTAGKRSAGWGEVRPYSDTRQRTDDLFGEYARILRGLMPRAFIAENVTGLVKGVAKGYFKQILGELRAAGYRVSARLVDASWLGVPQARQRIFFIGAREDLGRAPAFPAPLPYRYSVRDALAGAVARAGRVSGDIPAPTVQTHGRPFTESELMVVHETYGRAAGADVTDQPVPTITNGSHPGGNSVHFQVVHDNRRPNEPPADVTDRPAKTIAAGTKRSGQGIDQWAAGDQVTHDPETGKDLRIARLAIGSEWSRLAPGQTSDRYLNLVRPRDTRPLPTVTAEAGQSIGTAGVTHWAEPRKLTLIELRALCGFPADFILTGTYGQRWERLGRAVPPVMMYYLAAAIRDKMLT